MEEKSVIKINSFLPMTTQIEGKASQVQSEVNKEEKIYNSQVKLFGFIPVKNVNIRVVKEKTVIPCGNPFGVKIFTEGAVVVKVSGIKTEDGIVNPAKNAGLKKGDIILKINNTSINCNEDIAKIVENSGGQALILEVRRNNSNLKLNFSPCKCSEDGFYRAGIWVRDSSAGIGTMTFYDPESLIFVGLGHGICDSDTGNIMPLKHGEIVKATISGITRGEKGIPGELKGYFSSSEILGNLDANAECGVYGRLKNFKPENKRMKIALKQQIKTGPAKIICTIFENTQKEYDINIKEVNYKEDSPTKNMIIEITDEELLRETGGIVQGMSGSPIIQNDKLIGAVTHVFLNDPSKGYGIFAENMLDQIQIIYGTLYKNAT